MNKYTDLKVVAYAFQGLGVTALILSFIPAVLNDSILIALYGVVSFVWMYATGGALLILIDISKSVRASAVVAIEREDQRKEEVKPGSNGRSLGLKRVSPKKKRSA